MKGIRRVLGGLVLCLACSTPGWALDISPTNDANALASAIVGSAGTGITITGVTYTGASTAAGTYTAGPLGIGDGALLTSGDAVVALPPSNSGSSGVSHGLDGDPLCDSLTAPYPSRDASKLVITFDLDAGYDGVSLLFIFGSEEYPEYVGSSYNDVFGVYLNDTQVAFDASGAPITINGPFFSGGSVVVAPATETEYDGSTPILQTKAPLAGGSTGNTLVFIVCDAGDYVLDSGAFISGLIGCIGDDCSGTEPCTLVDADQDGVDACEDCDDSDPGIFPGAAEICDGLDNDCDGVIDEDNVCDPCPQIPDDETCFGPAGGCMGEGDAYCVDADGRMVCTGGVLMPESCGVDYCYDSGADLGGGACEATDYYCEAGLCMSAVSSGIDLCGVELVMAADLSTWTEESIGSADWEVSGDKQSVLQSLNGDPTFFYSDYDAIGGTLTGAISVVDPNPWDDDFIGFALGFQPGDTTNPAADYLLVDWKKGDQDYSPWGGYGYKGLAISRVTGVTDNTDFWTHTGVVEELQRGSNLGNVGWQDGVEYEFRIEFGATHVRVWVDNVLELDVFGDFNDGRFAFYNLSQAYVSYAGLASIPELGDDSPRVTYYSCAGGNTCVAAESVRTDSCVEDGGAYGGGTCEATNWSCVDGMLVSTSNDVTDTCGGSPAAPSVTWFSCVAATGVIADSCAPATTAESDSCAETSAATGASACSAVDWSCAAGVLAATNTFGVDTCGGEPDAPSLTDFFCDGGNTCVSEVIEKVDSCSDDGDAYGGGACSATNWECAGGVLSSSSTSGTDTCGGDADDPNVTYWSCAAADGTAEDLCVSAVTTQSDSCVDSGTPSGGGVCNATDWDCVGGVLASTTSSGVDTCGDGSESQTDYYVCGATDGVKNDLCVQVPDEDPPEVSVVLAEQAVLDDGLVVYQVYCDVVDMCDDDPTSSGLIETPSPAGLAKKLMTKPRTSIKFNLNRGKLDIFAPVPEAVLADLYAGGIPFEDGQSVTVKTHAGEVYHYTYKVQEGISLIELKGPWVRLWCFGEDDAGNGTEGYWEETYHPEQDCGCACQCDCPAGGECACDCLCEDPACTCECADGVCACGNP